MSELGEPRRRSRSPRRKGRGRGRPGRFGRLPSCLGRRAPARTPMAYPPAINIAPSALDPIPQSHTHIHTHTHTHTHSNTLCRVNGQTNERKMICNAWVDLVCVRLTPIESMHSAGSRTSTRSFHQTKFMCVWPSWYKGTCTELSTTLYVMPM